jgi:hypothetical protein
MILYHGTSEYAARSAQGGGVLPRSLHRGKPNWSHAYTGNRHAVYLTDAYPVTYAVEATDNQITRTGQQQRLAIIEIDTIALDVAKLVPDEDVLEQARRGKDGLPVAWSMLRRSRYYQARLQQEAAHWQTSLALLGTCAYMGVIPPIAIKRVALIDYQQAATAVWFALNASVTLANYRLIGVEHKAITRWFFGDPMPELTERERVLSGDTIDRMSSLPRDGVEVVS